MILFVSLFPSLLLSSTLDNLQKYNDLTLLKKEMYNSNPHEYLKKLIQNLKFECDDSISNKKTPISHLMDSLFNESQIHKASCETIQLSNKAIDFYKIGETKKSLELFSESCERGYSNACILLGLFNEVGFNVRQDYKKSNTFFEKMCTRDSKNCLYLGFQNILGHGVDKNFTKGIDYLTLSCKSGNIDSCLTLIFFSTLSEKANILYQDLFNFEITNNYYDINALGIFYFYLINERLNSIKSFKEYKSLSKNYFKLINEKISISLSTEPANHHLRFTNAVIEEGLNNQDIDGKYYDKSLEIYLKEYILLCNENFGKACYQLGRLYGTHHILKDLKISKYFFGKACDLHEDASCEEYNRNINQYPNLEKMNYSMEFLLTDSAKKFEQYFDKQYLEKEMNKRNRFNEKKYTEKFQSTLQAKWDENELPKGESKVVFMINNDGELTYKIIFIHGSKDFENKLTKFLDIFKEIKFEEYYGKEKFFSVEVDLKNIDYKHKTDYRTKQDKQNEALKESAKAMNSISPQKINPNNKIKIIQNDGQSIISEYYYEIPKILSIDIKTENEGNKIANFISEYSAKILTEHQFALLQNNQISSYHINKATIKEEKFEKLIKIFKDDLEGKYIKQTVLFSIEK